jgi:hypothetical protein
MAHLVRMGGCEKREAMAVAIDIATSSQTTAIMLVY